MPLSSRVHSFWWEVCEHFPLCSLCLACLACLFFSEQHFVFSSYHLFLSNLIVISLGMLFFVFILWVHWATYIYKFIVFAKISILKLPLYIQILFIFILFPELQLHMLYCLVLFTHFILSNNEVFLAYFLVFLCFVLDFFFFFCRGRGSMSSSSLFFDSI